MKTFVLHLHSREGILKSAKTRCCPASLLAIMVSELCFYFYKPLLCFLHQTVISVCVVVLDTAVGISVAFIN